MTDIIVISSEGEHRASVKRSRDEFILTAGSLEQDFEDEPEEKIECSPYKRRCVTPPTQSSLGDDVIVEDSQPFGDIPRGETKHSQHSAHSQAEREQEEDLPMHQPEDEDDNEEEEEQEQQQAVTVTNENDDDAAAAANIRKIHSVTYNGFEGEHGKKYQPRLARQNFVAPPPELSAVCPSDVDPLVWARYLTVHALTAFFEKAEESADRTFEMLCGLHAFDPDAERLSLNQGGNAALAPVFYITNTDLQRLKVLGNGFLAAAAKDFWENWSTLSIVLGGELLRYQKPELCPAFTEEYAFLLKFCGKTLHRLKVSLSALAVAVEKHMNRFRNDDADDNLPQAYVFYAHSSFGLGSMESFRLSMRKAVSCAENVKMRWCGPVAGFEKHDYWISDMIPEQTFSKHFQHGGLMFAELREASETTSRVWDTFVRSNGRMFVVPK